MFDCTRYHAYRCGWTRPRFYFLILPNVILRTIQIPRREVISQKCAPQRPTRRFWPQDASDIPIVSLLVRGGSYSLAIHQVLHDGGMVLRHFNQVFPIGSYA